MFIPIKTLMKFLEIYVCIPVNTALENIPRYGILWIRLAHILVPLKYKTKCFCKNAGPIIIISNTPKHSILFIHAEQC